MNKVLLALIISFCLIHIDWIKAQDIIKKNNAETLEVNIIATSKSDITYILKTAKNNDSIVSINKNICYSIQRKGQAEEILFEKEKNMEKELAKIVSKEDSLQEYFNGKDDARQYYRNFRKPGRVVLATSLFSPIIGLIPAIISTSTKVKEKNKFYPDPIGSKIDRYYVGYSKEAKKIKVKVVWRNWAFGFIANVIAVSIFASVYR
jgi:hypothetical protein